MDRLGELLAEMFRKPHEIERIDVHLILIVSFRSQLNIIVNGSGTTS